MVHMTDSGSLLGLDAGTVGFRLVMHQIIEPVFLPLRITAGEKEQPPPTPYRLQR